MKRLLRSALGRLGYRIIKTRQWTAIPLDEFYHVRVQNYQDLIEHCYGLYRGTILPGLPPVNEVRRNLLSKLTGTGVVQGLYLLDGLGRTMALPGDVCEFGVAHGATSALLANELLPTAKTLWLFDSFQGLPAPTKEDELQNDIFDLGSMAAYKGTMSFPENMARARLKTVGFPEEKTRVVAGFLDKSLARNPLPDSVAFAFVDLDLYQPIRQALDFLDRKLVRDGIAVVHDYGYFSKGAKLAVDEFVARRETRYEVEIPPPCPTMCILRKTAEPAGAGGA